MLQTGVYMKTYCNGCGCQIGILKYFTPPYANLFHSACYTHDEDYDMGGTEKDRKVIDKKLSYNMKKIICNYSYLKRLLLQNIIILYYISVRIFGRFYFNYK